MTDAVELPTIDVTASRTPQSSRERTLAERAPHPELSLRAALEGFGAALRVALPCVVAEFDPARMTVRAAPAIKARVLGDLGWESAEMPLLLDVPVVFPGGGGFALTFPVLPGDECLVVFADRCIDSWWQSGGVQEQAAHRLHSLSDGFALVGVRSLPNVLAGGVHAGGAELRSDDGAQHIRATGGGWHILGDVTVQGSVTATGDVTGQGTSLHTHVHGGTQPGGGNTGQPT